MIVSEACVATPMGARYLGQICKHFAHKLPVEYADTGSEHGKITFQSGTCILDSDPSSLRLRAESSDAESLARLEDVVVRHLARFAFRETLAITWSRLAA